MIRAIVLSIFLALSYYLIHQVLAGADLPLAASLLIGGFLAAMLGMILALPIYFWMASRVDHKPWYDHFYFYTYLSMAYINFLLFLLLGRDLLAALLFAFQHDYNSSLLYNQTAMGLLLVLPMVLILIGTAVVKVGVRHKKVILEHPELPKEFENFRLLHISDLHIGDSLPIRFVEKLISMSRTLKVDAVVFTGDILDGYVHRHQQELDLLQQLESAHGTFYVPGNHEYYWQGEQTINAFRKLGFRVLINESHTIRVGDSQLQIAGVPDPQARTFQFEIPDFAKLSASLVPESFKLLLAHQPHLADKAAPAGFHVQLSGHTHGGQFFPWNYFVGFVQKYAKGLYEIDNLKLYVNQGAGYWGPSVRLGTFCELAEIVLKKG